MLTSDYEELLKKSKDEIIHIVPRASYDKGIYIAYCGFDCSNRKPKSPGTANCIVCVELSPWA